MLLCGVITVVYGAVLDEETRMMQMQMGMMGAAPAGAFNAANAYAAERENVMLADWAPAPLLQAERELIAEAERLGLVGGAAAAAAPLRGKAD